MLTKEQTLKHYKELGERAKLQRERDFLLAQQIGQVDPNLKYSDETYYDTLGKSAQQMASPQEMNDFLTNLTNKLAMIDYSVITGSRAHLFDKWVRPNINTGSTVAITYTDIEDTGHYESDSFIPDRSKGGDLIKEQYCSLSNKPTLKSTPKDQKNPDKIKVSKTIPIITILQALNYNITYGLPGGWSSIFAEQATREWNKFKFNRQRDIITKLGMIPDSSYWTNKDTKWTANDASFVEVKTKITDEKSWLEFVKILIQTSADLEGDYAKDSNPAKIDQIVPMEMQGLYLHSDLKSNWTTTNSIVYNSKIIDVNQRYKSVDFLKLLESINSKYKGKKVLGVLYPLDGKIIRHYPVATKGIMLLTNMFADNAMFHMAYHFWMISCCDLSAPVKIFIDMSEGE